MKTQFSWAFLPITLLPVPALAQPYAFDFKVAPAEASGLKADATLSAASPQLQTTLGLAIQAAPNLSVADPLSPQLAGAASRASLGLDVAWTAWAAARLKLSLADKLGQSWNALPLAQGADHLVTTDERSAQVGLELTPLKTVRLTLTAGAAQNAVLDNLIQQSATVDTRTLFSTATESAGANLQWRPPGWFSLDAGGKLETTNSLWRGGATGAELTYAYFEPSITGILLTPSRGKLGLTFEQAVSPLDPGAFSSFAAVEDRSVAANFGPNRESRYRLSFDQTLDGNLQFSAAVINARIESATELGPVGLGLQAPESVTGGARQELNLSLSTPLAALGLPSFTLKGAGAWRRSQVRDPFTGDLRRPSGETPGLASLELAQAATGGRARWGLQGRFGGDQSFYQMSQVTNVSVADSLGGFIDYDFGTFGLHLQFDGLYGGDRSYTDLYYVGARGSGGIDHIDRRTDSGRAVQLILRKPL